MLYKLFWLYKGKMENFQVNSPQANMTLITKLSSPQEKLLYHLTLECEDLR